jgi:hypothetical protein
MKPRTKRSLAIVTGLAALGIASALVLNAFQSNMVFFFSPSQVAANEAPRERSGDEHGRAAALGRVACGRGGRGGVACAWRACAHGASSTSTGRATRAS